MIGINVQEESENLKIYVNLNTNYVYCDIIQTNGYKFVNKHIFVHWCSEETDS